VVEVDGEPEDDADEHPPKAEDEEGALEREETVPVQNNAGDLQAG
jgi:hypothetical protein